MDSRFPTQYLNDRRVMRCSLPAFRQLVLGTAWSVTNMTDGKVLHEDLPLVPFASAEHAKELVKLELWRETRDGYLITDFEKHQTSSAVMEAVLESRRKSERERQARKRAKDREDPDPPPSRGQSRDGHVTSQGKERQEQAQAQGQEEGAPFLQSVDLETGEIGSTSDSTPISPSSSAPGPSELWPDDPPVTPDGFGSAGDFVSNMQRQLRERRAG